MRKLTYLLLGVRNFLFPASCALCGCGLIGEEIRYSLCKNCRASLVAIWTRLPCRNGAEHSWERLSALFPYTGKYRKLLVSYKFDKNIAPADFFAEKVLEAINGDPELKEACIVPVPPRPGKIKRDGWDHVDFLAKRIGKIGGECSVCRCLVRKKSEEQKRLNREQRMVNMKGRVLLKGKAPKIALVIDDVITTGSTMEECSLALKKGGAEKVYGLCLFY